ncbi:Uncharacterised protein [Vibrio cholerae]|uniref:Uncharacterized protein n=1 Tax=Vibrio cholerae TaxID=666 RepID=A0A655NXI2_VIBCL|nr:Uncharacterised protein [Vibrio cholerae]
MVNDRYGLNTICHTQWRGLNPTPKTILAHIAQIISGAITALKPPIRSA